MRAGAKAVAYGDPGFAEIATENLFDKIHADPRWLAFLRKLGKARTGRRDRQTLLTAAVRECG